MSRRQSHSLETTKSIPLPDIRFRQPPKAFLISLNRTPERTSKALQELQKLGLRIEVIPAVDGKSPEASLLPRDPLTSHYMQAGEVGLCMSVWNLCSLIVRDNLEWALSFEDDVQIINLDGFMEALSLLPADFHFVHLNDANKPLPVIEDSSIEDPWNKVSHPSYVTVAYCISNAGARLILKNLAPFDRPIDVFFTDNENKANIYQVKKDKAWFTQSFLNQSTVRHSGEGKIPKIFHRIWLGPNPIPEEYERYWQSWKDHHPGYEFKTWTDFDEYNFREDGCKVDPLYLTYAGQSDFIRLHLLNKYGGIYIDTDFECFHSFNDLIENSTLLLAEESKDLLCNGFMASIKGHNLISYMLKQAPVRVMQGMGVIKSAGPGLVQNTVNPWRSEWSAPIRINGQTIAYRQGDTGIVIIDCKTMFPYYWSEHKPNNYGNAWAAHHWGRSWWTKKEWDDFYIAHPHMKPQLTENQNK